MRRVEFPLEKFASPDTLIIGGTTGKGLAVDRGNLPGTFNGELPIGAIEAGNEQFTRDPRIYQGSIGCPQILAIEISTLVPVAIQKR